MHALLLAGALTAPVPAPPWDVSTDLARLAVTVPGDQVLLRSSHCLSGCRYDRSEGGDTRFLRIEGDEQVVFEEPGAGAIVRIWMTHALGEGLPRDPGLRLRVRFDGESAPRIDVPLAAVFDGSTPPFLPPLVGDRTVSSGGHFSYVPLPYRRGCKVSLTGASEVRLWFQFAFHRLASPAAATTFRGDEELAPLRALLAADGGDPWTNDPGTLEQRQLTQGPGETTVLRAYDGPGTVTGLRIALPRAAWSTTRLALDFDGRRRVDLPVADFFAAEPAPGARSALVGVDAHERLYAWFPMPFAQRAVLTLRNGSGATLPVWYEVRRRPGPPLPDSGLFGAAARSDHETPIGVDIPLADLRGTGRLVGLFADLSSVDVPLREYLEGDERVYVDGSLHPALYGTGVEDLFGGGFYFDEGPFRLATHGSPFHGATPSGEDRTSMYRVFLTDAVPFMSRLRFGLEGGPTGELALRARRVAWYYQRPEPTLVRRRELVVGDEASRAAAQYTVGAPEACRVRSGAWEGEPVVWSEEVSCERRRGVSRFAFHLGGRPEALRLRRRFDATQGEQAAAVSLNGVRVGGFPAVEPNPYRLFRELDLDLPPDLVSADGVVRLEIAPAAGPPFSEMRWELWTSPPPTASP
jgi:D-arabinan exo alpha-(1,3)/(1,5)-arabinofuranosidase (non-reducing end)